MKDFIPADLVKLEKDNLEGIIGLQSRIVVGHTMVDLRTNSTTSRWLLFDVEKDPEVKRKSAEQIEALRKAYGKGDRIPPIAVVPHPSMPDRWFVKDGHHRVGAAVLAGLPFLPALILLTPNHLEEPT